MPSNAATRSARRERQALVESGLIAPPSKLYQTCHICEKSVSTRKGGYASHYRSCLSKKQHKDAIDARNRAKRAKRALAQDLVLERGVERVLDDFGDLDLRENQPGEF